MLYNKYRPADFASVIGQPSALVLSNISRGGRAIPHSILLSGTRGVGKTTLARIFARAINCQDSDPNKKPCGTCSSCKRIEHPDIYEIDSTIYGNPNSIQQLQQRMSLLPTFNYKVFILDEAHTITTKGMAILLKAVEEPSIRSISILLTTEPEKIDKALRSRCMWLQLQHIDKSELIKLLARVCVNENIKASKGAIYLIADYSDGSARDALSMLEVLMQYNELITTDLIDSVVGHRVNTASLADKICSFDIEGSFQEVNRLCSYHEPSEVIDSLLSTFSQKLQDAVFKKKPTDRFLKIIDSLRDARFMMYGAYDKRLCLELALVNQLLKDNMLPPIATMLSDWDAFTTYVSSAGKQWLGEVQQIKYVRLKGENTVLCKKADKFGRSFTAKGEIENLMRSYLRNDAICLEVL